MAAKRKKAKPKAKPKGRPRKDYGSMAQAAAALGISVDVIRFAKRSGCDAIRGNGSVDSVKLNKWIKDNADKLNEAGAEQSLRDQKIAEEVRKLKTYNDERDGLLVSKSLIVEQLRKFAANACNILDNTLVNEAPPRIVQPEEVPNARVQIRRYVDAAKEQIQQLSTIFDE